MSLKAIIKKLPLYEQFQVEMHAAIKNIYRALGHSSVDEIDPIFLERLIPIFEQLDAPKVLEILHILEKSFDLPIEFFDQEGLVFLAKFESSQLDLLNSFFKNGELNRKDLEKYLVKPDNFLQDFIINFNNTSLGFKKKIFANCVIRILFVSFENIYLSLGNKIFFSELAGNDNDINSSHQARGMLYGLKNKISKYNTNNPNRQQALSLLNRALNEGLISVYLLLRDNSFLDLAGMRESHLWRKVTNRITLAEICREYQRLTAIFFNSQLQNAGNNLKTLSQKCESICHDSNFILSDNDNNEIIFEKIIEIPQIQAKYQLLDSAEKIALRNKIFGDINHLQIVYRRKLSDDILEVLLNDHINLDLSHEFVFTKEDIIKTLERHPLLLKRLITLTTSQPKIIAGINNSFRKKIIAFTSNREGIKSECNALIDILNISNTKIKNRKHPVYQLLVRDIEILLGLIVQMFDCSELTFNQMADHQAATYKIIPYYKNQFAKELIHVYKLNVNLSNQIKQILRGTIAQLLKLDWSNYPSELQIKLFEESVKKYFPHISPAESKPTYKIEVPFFADNTYGKELTLYLLIQLIEWIKVEYKQNNEKLPNAITMLIAVINSVPSKISEDQMLPQSVGEQISNICEEELEKNKLTLLAFADYLSLNPIQKFWLAIKNSATMSPLSYPLSQPKDIYNLSYEKLDKKISVFTDEHLHVEAEPAAASSKPQTFFGGNNKNHEFSVLYSFKNLLSAIEFRHFSSEKNFDLDLTDLHLIETFLSRFTLHKVESPVEKFLYNIAGEACNAFNSLSINKSLPDLIKIDVKPDQSQVGLSLAMH